MTLPAALLGCAGSASKSDQRFKMMFMFRMQRIYGRDAGGLPKGYTGSYRFFRDDFPLSQCHFSRWCTKPSEFIPLSDNEADRFILRPKRLLMPFTWIVEDCRGELCGSLKRKLTGKTSWQIRDANSREIGRFRGRYNPRFWLFRIIDWFLGNRPDGYQIIVKGKVVARMERESRPENPSPIKQKGIRRLVGKVLRGKDWVIREEADAECLIDYRLLLSGALLLESISRDVSA
jgi:hypothetical protein